MIKKIVFFTLIFSLFIPSLTPVSAAEFNSGYILSDFELRDAASMSLEDIKFFLSSKSGAIKSMTFEDVDGQNRSAAEIIFKAAVRYQINPKYLLVLLQKEQSLIEDSAPLQKQLDWATGYAVCDSCSKDDPLIQKFKGFAKQIDRAAWRNKYYIDHPWEFRHQPGNTYEIDGETVNIFNQATANLYNYTPHIHGNYNFWKLWNRYFSQMYPDGSLLQVEGELGVWLIQYGEKRPFLSRGAFYSRYDQKDIIIVQKNDLNAYPTGNPIKYAQYSLLRQSNGSIYLLSDDKLRHIVNQEVFRTIGFNLEEVIHIADEEMPLFEKGEDIDLSTTYPAGTLLQDNETGGVFYVQNGIKHPIINRYILDINYPNHFITPVSSDELVKYERGNIVQVRDGVLIKSFDSPQVYVISNGQKLLIPSEKIFNTLGYNWHNILTIDPSTIVNIASGGEINLDYLEE